MALVQTYETTISMADGSLAVSCLIVPHRSADINGVELSPRETRNMFAATISIPIDPSSLPNALASILVAQKQGVDVIETYIRLNKSGFVDWEIEIEKRSEEHTSELQSPDHLVCRLLLEKKKINNIMVTLHEVITFLLSMQISISSLQTHNVNRCGRSRHLARKLSLRRKRSSPNVFEMAATETITSIILIKLITVSLGFFFFNSPPTTDINPFPLPDTLPI